MKAFTIGASNVRRMLRERSNIFFVFIFPIALIFLIGSQFGGGVNPAVGIYQADDGELSSLITTAIQETEDLDVRMFQDQESLKSDIERGFLQAGLFLPGGMDEIAASGDQIPIDFVARPDGAGPQLQAIIGSAIAEVMKPVGAAQFASTESGASFEEALAVARAAAPGAPDMTVEMSAVGEALFPESFGQFDLGAPSQLVLFVFLTAMAGSAALIQTRQLGISSRMLSTPTSVRTIVLGESLGRFGTAMVQGLYIVLLTWVIFSVNWGDPLGSLLVLVTFAAVGAGAGVLMGSVFSNDQQAAGVGIIASIGLAALGGSMMPIEFFGDTLRQVAHITPHAWALDAFSELIRRDGSVVDILPDVGVLALYASVLLALAAWRLRVAITRP